MNAITEMPSRLHHNAYVVKDLERTRKFYEDVVGMPLVATWCEVAELFGKERVYAHCFFALEDSSALAFFQFANADDQAEFGPELPVSGFRHIALKVEAPLMDKILKSVTNSGHDENRFYVLEHGYCRSLYVLDPDDLIVEFCVDHPDYLKINEDVLPKAHSELARWLAGDHTPNNEAFHRHAD